MNQDSLIPSLSVSEFLRQVFFSSYEAPWAFGMSMQGVVSEIKKNSGKNMIEGFKMKEKKE